MSVVLSPLDRLGPVVLADLDHTASLQTRVDRKYLAAPDQLATLIDRIGDQARVLEIDRRRSFAYHSTYFDTPTFDSYLGAARRRPNRFKVRTRRYLDTEGCWVEVKLRDRRGRTVKQRHRHDPDAFDQLTPTSLVFVASHPGLQDLAHELQPVLGTSYRRSTLLVGAARTTIDVGVTCSSLSGRVDLGELVVVETKSAGGPSLVDRVLWDLHLRPARVSKFGIGMAALHPGLPANKWYRLLATAVRPLDCDGSIGS